MSVVALPARRPGRIAPPRQRATPTLTITLDLGAGAVTPGLTRLLDLLGELAASGVLHHEEASPGSVGGRWHAADPAAPSVPPVGPAEPGALADLDAVRILAGTRVVRHADRDIPLTRIEYELLLFLARHPRRVFTRGQLLSHVWGYEHAVARTVDVHVRRLRAKFGPDIPLVTTVHGVGYRLADDARVMVDPEH